MVMEVLTRIDFSGRKFANGMANPNGIENMHASLNSVYNGTFHRSRIKHIDRCVDGFVLILDGEL